MIICAATVLIEMTTAKRTTTAHFFSNSHSANLNKIQGYGTLLIIDRCYIFSNSSYQNVAIYILIRFLTS
jgi:hypothetical protein